MVASFSIRKDYKTYLNAATNILERRNDVTFLAIGGGDGLNDCLKMVKPEVSDKIKFLGIQKSVESIINIFDIGVLSTYTEGISNSIMEYMALSKPVVSTNGGGTCEIVVNKLTGFLIKPKNVEELTEKIEFLLNNKQTAKEMGKAGKERLCKDFSIKKMTDRFFELYKKGIE